jgi:hypothetical protein
VYTRCIWCTADLGKNETLEDFPVGRRVAFDAAKGRLWVVCRACERWNLTPLEERWEAIEAAERRYRDTKKRVSTDQIGLARVDDGLDLIRIGEPLRPEFAAWRYGDQFGRRWRRNAAWTAGAVALVGGYIVAGPVMGWVAGGGSLMYQVPNFINMIRNRQIGATIDDAAGAKVGVLRGALNLARIDRKWRGDSWTLEVPRVRSIRAWRERREAGLLVFERNVEALSLEGDVARRAVATLLPHVNASGGTKRSVQEAVQLLESAGDIEAVFHRASRAEAAQFSWGPDGTLRALPLPLRLALEMGTHEAEERQALLGEISVLKSRWQDAEEIAAIADNMFVPDAVEHRVAELKAQRPPTPPTPSV